MPDRQFGRFGPLIGALDEGTSSVRFIIFCVRTSDIIVVHQIPLKGIYPQEGYVEQDPKEIMTAVYECFEKAIEKLIHMEVSVSDLAAVGITNQRETVVAWNKVTGEPLYNAVVWSDMRTTEMLEELKEKLPNKDVDYFKDICGLPLAPTFSALKYKWLLDEVPAVKAAAAKNQLSLGTIDSWLIYNLTGGKDGGIFVTDCTNASRTMLLNLKLLKWESQLCKFFSIDQKCLPEVKSSSEIYGYIKSDILKGVPISGCLGDQQAALLGHLCLEAGQTKNTYGTGCFLLCNTGSTLVTDRNGLIGTVAFKLGKNAPVKYAIEGAVAVAGAAINWLRDNLEILNDAKDAESIAESITGENDVYFVPAFSGLYAPYWEQNARGVIIGLTAETTSSNLVRAALEAVCFQTRDIIEAMKKSGYQLKQLLVDGGLTRNNYVMQLQADLIGIPVVRPGNHEMTALGAAIAAGSAEGVKLWNIDGVPYRPNKVFTPSISPKERDAKYLKWKAAVESSFSWKLDA